MAAPVNTGSSPRGRSQFQAPRAIPASSLPIRRRSSVTERLGLLGDYGGVNSFNNFARSWTRAAGFHDFSPGRRPTVVRADMGEHGSSSESQQQHPSTDNGSPLPRTSLLGAALRERARDVSESPIVDDGESGVDQHQAASSSVTDRINRHHSLMHQESGIFQHNDVHFGSPFRTGYGSFTSRPSQVLRHQEPSPKRPSHPIPAVDGTADQEAETLLAKDVETEEGETTTLIVGRSTVPQTVFNSVNTLIGVGMLSLPLGLKYSGWVIGLVFFLFASVTTSYTAKLLAKCLDVDVSLLSFADLAYVSFGRRARYATSILFCLELLASCMALVILFADSMNALLPQLDITQYKIICGFLLIPLGFVPLSFLSFTSVLGIICCLWIVIAVFADGLTKPETPGSLRDVASTHAFPGDWRTLPLAFGLLMAPWGGHSVFPNIYRDMRHPRRYPTAVNTTYTFTYTLETWLMIIGYLMFGSGVRDEITSNIFLTAPGNPNLPQDAYPHWLSITIAAAIALIPLTKAPLNARPIVSVFEHVVGILPHNRNALSKFTARSSFTVNVTKFAVRSSVIVVFTFLAILIPSFDRVMSLLGSLACSLVCVVLPVGFHLRIFESQLSKRKKLVDWGLLGLFAALGFVGTVFACLPKKWLGAS
ncbi:MAG: hypothetical protein M1831_001932 [Alyxoria varia]|nr:MAG: hypothetical protein M1831_001932 [Alyxoria varia]